MKLVRRCSLLLAAVVLAGCVPAPPPPPPPPPPTTIVFISDRTGNAEVWSMHADGTYQTQLTNDTDLEREPKLSPDAKQIVFVRRNPDPNVFPNEVLWVMNVDGTNQHEVLAPPIPPSPPSPFVGSVARDRDPAWSSDSTQIAFVRDGIGRTGILIMNADGTNAHVFVPSPEPERMTHLAWSPDGTRIAYSYDLIGQAANFVLVDKVDGTGGSDLTAPAGGHNPQTALGSNDEPAWSPDSNRIAFLGNGDPAGPVGIWTINADGTNPVPLTDGASPSWSPDGNHIAFERAGNVWTMNADGSGQTLLTSGTEPNWQPKN